MKRILLLIVVICACFMAHADTLAKGIEVSVLTCSPGQEVYSLYGHTAIRVRDGRTGEDEVFNYGIFDFNTEHFVWKFVLGETDYICASVPWNYFIREYEKRGSSVAVQVLNLTQAEAVRVKEYLYRNVQPENRVYRYSFLTNNCTTKVMDCVEACVEGDIVYSWTQEPYTYRTILHKYTEAYPWEQEGNDFLLGADVDTVLSHRATCFIPDFYKNALDGAVVRGEFEDTRKLVTSTQVWRASDNTVTKSAEELLATPLTIGWVSLVLGVLLMGVEYIARRMFWLVDVVLMTAHGLAGCLLSFVFFFSQHPTLDSNWLVLVLNPLPLVALPFVVKAAWRDNFSLWHHFMAVWIAMFLLFIPWMPQNMPVLAVFVLVTLLTRQLSYILHYGCAKSARRGGKRKNTPKKKK